MLCDKKHSHVQWRDFKMNVLVCDDDQQIVDSIIEELKKKSEETHVALRFYGFSQPSQIDLQMKIQVKQFAKKKIEALVKKDMQEWPPGCAGWMYQPKRPYVPEKHLQEKRK